MNTVLRIAVAASGFLALVLLLVAGPLYQLEWLGLSQAFGLMRWAFYLGVTSVVVTLGYAIWRRPGARFGSVLALSAVAGLIAAYVPLDQMRAARAVPRIHGISTDIAHPAEVWAVLPSTGERPIP